MCCILIIFFLMMRRPPRSTRTDTLFPYTTLFRALTELSPGMKVIVDQRAQLTAMLSSLDKLSTVTVSTLDAAQDDIVADFKALAPILEQLAKAGSDLPNSLQMLLTYPFPDRSEEHTSELQSLMRISYAVF